MRRTLFLAVSLILGLAGPLRAEVKPFTFAHITDSHIGVPGYAESLVAALKDMDTSFPEVAFVIHTGDVTDLGLEDEFTSYAQTIKASKRKIYAVTGNHDTRWSDNGKEAFKKHVGPTYQSFEHNGVRFVLLDVAMLVEQYAHFDGQQMAKLEQELRALPSGQPAVLAMHHPPLTDGRYYDNDYEFADMIRRYNVPLICDGHGHTFERYTINNTTYAMGGTTSNVPPRTRQTYRVYRVFPDRIELLTRDYLKKTTKVEPPIATQRPRDEVGALVQLAAGRPGDPVRFQLEMPEGKRLKSGTSTVDGYLDGKAESLGRATFTVAASSLSNGVHQIVANFVDDMGTTHARMAYFRTESQKAPAGYARYEVFPASTLDIGAATPLRPALAAAGVKPLGLRQAGAGFVFIGGGGGGRDEADDYHQALLARGLAPRVRGIAGTEKRPTGPGAAISREFPLLSGGQAHPAVENGVLYVGANDNRLRAFDLWTGKRVWEKQTGAEILSAPAVTSTTLVVGSLDGNIYCLDPRTGAEIWRFPAGAAVMASPLIRDNTVFVGTGGGRMLALDVRNGKERWSFSCGKHIKATPAFAGGRLFFGAWDNWFYCVNAADGKLEWKVPASTRAGFSAATCNPVTTGSRVIVVTHDYSVRCLDQKTGAHLWLYRPEKDELGPSYSSPVLYGNMVVMASISGRVVGHDIDSGRKVMDIPVRAGKADALFDSVPVLDGNRLYVGSVGGNLYCVDLAEQQVAWSAAMQPGFVFTRPALWNDRVLVSTMGNRVVEIRAPGNAPKAVPARGAGDGI